MSEDVKVGIQPQAEPGASATPQEDPNTAVNADPAPATSPAPAESDPAKEPADKSDKMLRELTEQRRKRQLAEQEIAYLRGKLEGAAPTKPGAQTHEPPPVQVPKRPRMEDFPNVEEFEAATEAYNDARDEARYRARREQERLEEQQRQAHARRVELDKNYTEKLKKDAELYPDVYESIDKIGGFIREDLGMVIKASDIPAALITYFDRNPAELARLNESDPLFIAKEVGRIEERLLAKNKPNTPLRVVSQAPDPLKVPQSTGPPVTDESQLSDEEWWALRNKRQQERFEQVEASRRR